MTDPATRLKAVPIEEFDAELRTLVAADDKTLLELGGMQIHAHRPSHAKAIVGLHNALWTDRLLPDRLLELVRLRIAFFNQCRSCMAIRYPGAIADGLTEDLVCSLEKPYTAADLSDPPNAQRSTSGSCSRPITWRSTMPSTTTCAGTSPRNRSSSSGPTAPSAWASDV